MLGCNWSREGGHQRRGKRVAEASVLCLKDWGLNLRGFLWPEASIRGWGGGGHSTDGEQTLLAAAWLQWQVDKGLWPLKAARNGRTDKRCSDAAQRAGELDVMGQQQQQETNEAVKDAFCYRSTQTAWLHFQGPSGASVALHTVELSKHESSWSGLSFVRRTS